MSKKTPEDKVKDRIKATIEEVCARRGMEFCIDWHAGTMFTTTLDATGVVAGHPFILEAKRFDDPDADLTGRQKVKASEFRRAGATVHTVVDETALRYLRNWLEQLEPREPFEL